MKPLIRGRFITRLGSQGRLVFQGITSPTEGYENSSSEVRFTDVSVLYEFVEPWDKLGSPQMTNDYLSILDDQLLI